MIHYISYLLCTRGTDKMANIVHLLFIWILSFCTSSLSEKYCPTGAKIDRDGLHCYWMPAFTSTWLGARDICQRENEGDLATVDSVTVQTFIQNSFQMDSSVWLRNGMAQGLFENSDATTFQPEDPMKVCTSMALATGQWMNEICDNENSIICQRKISVSLPSSESYVTGVPLMSAIYKVPQIQLLPSPPDPGQRRVEVKVHVPIKIFIMHGYDGIF
ncbi:polycystin-1-like [Misgurnus anguillicaudatus]|uniref:polycystin-1-like n=1 Tax=Misgurnus anguillicaudatus TaxID=75329 RepID=UPI003CCFCFFB